MEQQIGFQMGVVLVVGCVVGWLTAKIVHGTGKGLVADIAVGVAGAFIGYEFEYVLGVMTGGVADVFTATIGALIGAVLLLLVVRFAAQKLR